MFKKNSKGILSYKYLHIKQTHKIGDWAFHRGVVIHVEGARSLIT